MNDALVEAVETCRMAAEKMNLMGEDANILFPGWDFAGCPDEERRQCEAIRRAAAAILGSDDGENGTYVPLRDVALLVHYIADMLEE